LGLEGPSLKWVLRGGIACNWGLPVASGGPADEWMLSLEPFSSRIAEHASSRARLAYESAEVTGRCRSRSYTSCDVGAARRNARRVLSAHLRRRPRTLSKVPRRHARRPRALARDPIADRSRGRNLDPKRIVTTGVLHRVLRSRIASAQLEAEVRLATCQDSHPELVSFARAHVDADDAARHTLRCAQGSPATSPRAPTSARSPDRTHQSSLNRG